MIKYTVGITQEEFPTEIAAKNEAIGQLIQKIDDLNEILKEARPIVQSHELAKEWAGGRANTPLTDLIDVHVGKN